MDSELSCRSKHYLEEEFERLIQNEPSTWQFLQQESLDGVWYWDLEQPDKELMSPEMWALFGIDPTTKRHDPAEWHDIIFKEDLQVALENFERHCAGPKHPYDQIVLYRHVDTSLRTYVHVRALQRRYQLKAAQAQVSPYQRPLLEDWCERD